jgi:murein DD-endopeptidase MepM/ murein hydrolase activator NlpD
MGLRGWFRALCVGLVVVGLPAALASGARAEDAAEVRARAQEITQRLSDAETRLGELDRAMSTAEFEAEDAARQLAALQADVERAAVERYTNRDRETLLLRADANGDLRAAALLRLVGQDDRDAIDRYRSLRAEADEAGDRLARLESEQEAAIASLRETSTQLQEELRRLEELERRQREAAARRAAEAARAEEARLAREAAAATTVPSAGEPPAPAPDDGGGGGGGGGAPPPPSAGFVCPVPGATFIDSWGFPRAGGRSHQGVDMMAPTGAPVYAPVSGTVRTNQNGLGGLAFYLDGDNGNRYYGAHLSAYGQTGRVGAGTVIGYVGNTGDARFTAPHLHFEIHPGGGGAVNPYPTVRAAC